MSFDFSKRLLRLSCSFVAFTIVVTFFWIGVLNSRSIIAAAALWFGAGGYSIVAVTVIVMPATKLYLRERQRRDLWSVCLSSGCCLLIWGESIALYFIPLSHHLV